MKHMMVGAVGLMGALAGCGTLNGATTAEMLDIRTEYRNQSGKFVACDNVTDGGGLYQRTQISVYFDAFGSVNSVNVGLRGNTSPTYDGNYNASAVTANGTADGTYRVTFNATADGGFLPTGITVNPTRNLVKNVLTTDLSFVGSFRADMTVNTPSGPFEISTAYLPNNRGNISVYTMCNVTSTTTEPV